MSKFEIHLTYDCEVPEIHGWKYSKIDGDPVLGSGARHYLTTYAGSLDAALLRIQDARDELYQFAGSLQREKVEEIVYDKRFK